MISTMKNRAARALSRMNVSARVLVVMAFAGLASSACDVHSPSAPGTLATITVTPNTTLSATSTQQMTAIGRDADGREVAITPTWTVAASGGTINNAGMFSAGTVTGLFEHTVVATVGGVSGSASITVTPGALARISVVPNPITMAAGSTQQFIAVGFDASGNIVQFTPTWSVVANGGTITDAGVFTAGAIGTYTNTVQATRLGIRGFATVNVTIGPVATIAITPASGALAVGAKQQFIATGTDAGGNSIPIAVTWSVVAGGGSIDGSGLFTAGAAPGTFTNTVKATSGSLSGVATVVVSAGALAFITITPNPATMAINSTLQLTAVGTDVGGNVVAITPTWAVVTTSNGASVTQTGLYTSGTVVGTFLNKVRATSGTIAGFATINASNGPLTAITVTPTPVFMPTNATQQFAAVANDAFGNSFAVTPTWSVVNGGGSINGFGMFTSNGTAGSYVNTVKATSGALSGFASVTTSTPAIPPLLSPLNSAGDFGILAGAGIACAISGSVTGATAANIGSSPTNTITGFPLPCTFSGSIPLPGIVSTAKGDLTTAYLAAQGQVCNLDLSGIDLGFYDGSTPAKTLAAGTYCFSTSAAITGTLKLTGSASAVWTFQVGSTFDANVGSAMIMAGGAIADHVYWAVGSSATLKTSSVISGNIMSLASITLQANTVLNGRALAQTGAVSMIAGGASIIKP